MPLISRGDRRGWNGRLAVWFIYLVLILGGITMAYPFMVTLTGSISSAYDYDRRSPVPRFLSSRAERLMRTLCIYYPPEKRVAMKELRSDFPDWPTAWLTWRHAGDDVEGAAVWADRQLARLEEPAQATAIATMATDYHDFMMQLDVRSCTVCPDSRYVAPFLRERYGDVASFNASWEMALDDFTDLGTPGSWTNLPYYHQSFIPEHGPRMEDLMALYENYRDARYHGFLRDDPQAVSPLRPATLAFTWEQFAAGRLGIADPAALHALPFPVPADAPAELRAAWLEYLLQDFPLYHVGIAVDDAGQARYTGFLRDRFRNIAYFNSIVSADDPSWTPAASWDEQRLTATMPEVGVLAKAWINFVKTTVPPEQWEIRDSLPEQAFQRFALERHGSLAAVNQAYDRELKDIHALRVPCQESLLATFSRHEMGFTWDTTTRNYRMVLDYLILRGRAAFNTIVLIILCLVVTLTVNPLAGYALSRFRLPQTERILIFCLATMAFPAAVAAIPGFLLLRDLSLLNTFAALVLPGAASGMGIFMLKGFFDSLPQELYEAATIDGAPEWQIFFRISLPLVKPILAVNLLGSFIAAYSGWEWAIIVCQDQKMWTIAVWTYQFSQLFASQPFAVMAAYMITSLPVFVVFLLCQNIIMRGIILPQMK